MRYIKSPRELYHLIKDECNKNDQDIRLDYFSCPVRMKRGAIIEVYRKLAREFNGTFVGHLANYQRTIDQSDNRYSVAGYDDTSYVMKHSPYFDEVFTGSGSAFLQTFFRDPDQNKGWWRILTDNENYLQGKPVTGYALKSLN